ncbi:MAG TPA: hypothetical protein VH796_19295 [Nitrososphaeraceae archaeon]
MEKQNISELFGQSLKCFRCGKIKVDVASQHTFEIDAENNKIILNLLSLREFAFIDSKKRKANDLISLREKISEAKDFAKSIRNNGLTISIHYKSKEIIILGKEAKPKISRIFTGSNDMQIKNIRLLKKFDNELCDTYI